MYAPEEDPELKVEHYTRLPDQNELLGLDQMNAQTTYLVSWLATPLAGYVCVRIASYELYFEMYVAIYRKILYTIAM